MLKPVARTLAVLLMIGAAPAEAGPAGDALTAALYAGDLETGLQTLAPMASRADPEAQFGLGLLRFSASLEHLVQALYRHGLSAPDTGAGLGLTFAMPIPLNPNPAPLDYPGVRKILSDFVTELDAARDDLDKAGASGDYAILIDPTQIKFDINGDGEATASENVAAALSQLFDMPADQVNGVAPGAPDASKAPAAPFAGIAFDRADAIWLAGYSEVLAAQADFLLAHDFSEFTNVLFHRFFPKAGFPMENYANGGQLMLNPESDSAIADAVAAIHTINWPAVEPDRLKRVLDRLKSVIAHSRANWAAILAETDDNHELLPSPTQTSVMPDGAVTQDKIDAWMKTLDTADQILSGALLVPHWRFKQGFDLKAYFESAKRTDFVMMLSGYGALPYLRDGPVASRESFLAAETAFGDQLLGYAFWFN